MPWKCCTQQLIKTKMEQKFRRILEQNRGLLTRNIIITSKFIEKINSKNVLPDSMMKAVQDCKTQEEKNDRLLNLLQLRGRQVFSKFRNILHETGHLLLAQHLYDEEYDADNSIMNDIQDNLPEFCHHWTRDQKRSFCQYVENKIKESVLKQKWKMIPEEQVQILEARKQFHDKEQALHNIIQMKDKMQREIEKKFKKAKDELANKTRELERLEAELTEEKESHSNQISDQLKFNTANNKSVIRLDEKLNLFNATIREMNIKICDFLGETMPDADEVNSELVKVSVLEERLSHLLQEGRGNIIEKVSHCRDRVAILKLLNRSDRQQSLYEVVHKYFQKEEKGKAMLWREIEKLKDTLKVRTPSHELKTKITHGGGKRNAVPRELVLATDLRYLRNQVALMRAEAEHIQKIVQWKDSEMQAMQYEMMTLQMAHKDKQHIFAPPPTPDPNFTVASMEENRIVPYIPSPSKCLNKDGWKRKPIGSITQEIVIDEYWKHCSSAGFHLPLSSARSVHQNVAGQESTNIFTFDHLPTLQNNVKPRDDMKIANILAQKCDYLPGIESSLQVDPGDMWSKQDHASLMSPTGGMSSKRTLSELSQLRASLVKEG